MAQFEILSAEQAAEVTNIRPTGVWTDAANALISQVPVAGALRINFETNEEAGAARRAIRNAVTAAGFGSDKNFIRARIVKPTEENGQFTLVMVKVQEFLTHEEQVAKMNQRAANTEEAE